MNPDSTKKRLTPTYPMEEIFCSQPLPLKTFIARAWKNTTCSAAKKRSEVNSDNRGLAVSMFKSRALAQASYGEEYIRCRPLRQSILKRLIASHLRWTKGLE